MSRIFTNIWKLASIALILSALVAALSARADTVTSGSSFATTLEAGEESDVVLLFTTPTGAAEGSTITVEFDADFDTASLTEDDVDVVDDGADLTTAEDCSGAEEASVAMAADVITITICAGDGGAIAAGSEIEIEIGLVATESGIGSNQIGNPADEGTYYISVAGSFGDSGSFAIPINGDDTIDVTATVSQGGGGGPSGGGSGCGDSTAPTLSGITVSSITESSAIISWTTSESADSEVDYGETDAYEIGTESDSSLTTSHAITLEDLSEATEYHFQVRSEDLCGNEATSSDETFTTADVTACANSSIEVVDIGETTARVTWDTDESATSLVEYGLNTTYGTAVSDGTFVTEHSVILTGLTKATTYHYRVTCEDASGNEGVSGDDTFTTTEDDAPANVSDLTADAGDGTCDLSWSNPPDDDLAGVFALICEDDYPTSPTDSDCTETFDDLAEGFTDTGLTNGTTYYYGVFAYDEAGQFASGALVNCTPSAAEGEGEGEEEEGETPTEEETPGETTEEGEEEGEGEGETTPTEETGEEEEGEEEIEETPTEEEGEEGEEIPETSVGEEELVPSEDVSFLVEDGAVELEADEDGTVEALADSSLIVELSGENVDKEVDHVLLIVGADMYLMSEADGAYTAEVATPDESGTYAVVIIIFYEDGTSQTLRFSLDVLEPGYTYELTDATEVRVGGSTVTLFSQSRGTWEAWDASPYSQNNPVTTGSDGTFSWHVPNGRYRVEARKDGYNDATVNLTVSNGIVNPRVLMTPTTMVEEIIETIVPNALEELLATLRKIPGIQETAKVALLMVAVAAVASALTLAVAFNLLPFLQYLFTSPVLFFWRRKRKAFGIVYNAYSKIPIDLAIVRLYRLPKRELESGVQAQPGDYRVVVTKPGLVRTRVTDKEGKFSFLTQPGDYRVVVTKPGFLFPSQYLMSMKDDGMYLDVYHGETIRVNEQDVTITPNIPVDPIADKRTQTPTRIRWMKRLRVTQHTVAITGVLLAAYVFVVRPSLLTLGLAALQIVIYLLVRRLARARKPKSWGIVYDQTTGRPLGNVIVRIFEPKYHKLLETSLTDGRGRYTALLGPSQYYSTYEKTGYETVEVKPIDYSQKKETTELAIDVELPLMPPDGTSEETSERSLESKAE